MKSLQKTVESSQESVASSVDHIAQPEPYHIGAQSRRFGMDLGRFLNIGRRVNGASRSTFPELDHPVITFLSVLLHGPVVTKRRKGGPPLASYCTQTKGGKVGDFRVSHSSSDTPLRCLEWTRWCDEATT